jgi:hypothetical protein
VSNSTRNSRNSTSNSTDATLLWCILSYIWMHFLDICLRHSSAYILVHLGQTQAPNVLHCSELSRSDTFYIVPNAH